MPGDYDGDGKTDLGAVSALDRIWYILQSSTGYTTYSAQQWGLSTDILVPGDYDGDGKTDSSAPYRPSTGYWHLATSTGNLTYIAEHPGFATMMSFQFEARRGHSAGLRRFRRRLPSRATPPTNGSLPCAFRAYPGG